MDPEEEAADTGGDASSDSTDAEDDLWDWGDFSDCPGCDAAVFAGDYDTTLQFTNADVESVVCTTPLVVTLDESGSLYETASCTSSTGLDFFFEFDLFVTFDCEYGTPEAACLAGSASLTLPSGDVYTASFAERGFLAGYVTTATGPFSLSASRLLGGPPSRLRPVPWGTTWIHGLSRGRGRPEPSTPSPEGARAARDGDLLRKVETEEPATGWRPGDQKKKIEGS